MKKYVTILLVFLILTFCMNNVIYASVPKTVDLRSSHQTKNYLRLRGIYAIVVDYVTYNYEGKNYPAYCLDRHLSGVEMERGGYTGTIIEPIQQENVWRTMINGYPYKSPEQLGVANVDEAYFATKMAVYYVININNGDTSRPLDLYEVHDEDGGQRVLDAMKNIINAGLYGSETRKNAELQIEKIGETTIDTADNNYISQTYKVTSNAKIKDITPLIKNNELEVKVTDINGTEKKVFQTGENFKVLVPTQNIKKMISLELEIKAQADTKRIYYAKSPSPELQSYAAILDRYEEISKNIMLEYEPKGTIIINKLAEDDNSYNGNKAGKGIEGVKFLIKSVDGKFEKESITDVEGRIKLELPTGKYIVQEIQEAKFYIKNDKIIEMEIEYANQIKSIDVYNKSMEAKVEEIKEEEVKEEIKEPQKEIPVEEKKEETVSKPIESKPIAEEPVIKKLPKTGY